MIRTTLSGGAILAIALLFLPGAAGATAGFARQTGGACSLCHFQDTERLSEYGRLFRLHGFRETEAMREHRRGLEARAAEEEKNAEGAQGAPE